MKTLALLTILIFGCVTAQAVGTQVYHGCTEWSNAYPEQNAQGQWVWYQNRTCEDYIIDWTTYPPTKHVIHSEVERRGGYPPNVD